MKKTSIYFFCMMVLIAVSSCAKEAVSGPNDANKRFIDAWMHVNHPGNKAMWNGVESPDSNGIYILEFREGDKEPAVSNDGYAIVDYKTTDLEGNIISYTSAETARQLGEYSMTNYYGPKVWLTKDATIQAGLQNAITGMKVGGYKKVLIPSWLMSYSSFDTPGEYLANSTDYANTIYEFTVHDFTKDINQWQIDSIKRYIEKEYGSLEKFTNDSTGFYYMQKKAPVSDKEFPSDTTIYINYTGKLLNGLVFDTNMERVAKDNGLYDPSKTYGPTSIKWGENHGDITMGSGSSSVISGFSLTLWQMKPMEKGIGIFYSPLGYGYNGSEPAIPPYAPLIFEIEIVEEPED